MPADSFGADKGRYMNYGRAAIEISAIAARPCVSHQSSYRVFLVTESLLDVVCMRSRIKSRLFNVVHLAILIAGWDMKDKTAPPQGVHHSL